MALESPYNLGVAAYKRKNYTEAAAQWTKAVARGNTDAMNNLAYLLYYGYGTAKDLEGAIALWRAAAYSGHSEAQWHLGNAYETGIGVEENPSRAYAWFRCSVETASKKIGAKVDSDVETNIRADARDSLTQLLPKLMPNELERGQAMADEYIARYGSVAP